MLSSTKYVFIFENNDYRTNKFIKIILINLTVENPAIAPPTVPTTSLVVDVAELTYGFWLTSLNLFDPLDTIEDPVSTSFEPT